MKLYYIGLLRCSDPVLELALARNLLLFLFFEKGSVSEFMNFFAETVAARTTAGQRQLVQERNFTGHVYTHVDGLTAVLITDQEYPVRPAFTLLNKVVDEYLALHPPVEWKNAREKLAQFAYAELDTYLQRYQDPSQADGIMRVQQELDETKIVLHKTIELMLERGERLDTLVDKSLTLLTLLRMFYQQAKKTNLCCVIV